MSNSKIITIGTLTVCSICNKVATCFQCNYGRRNFNCIECLEGTGELQSASKDILKQLIEQ